jgi:hypothetical protein
MTFTSPALLAEGAEAVTRTTFEWGRIQENTDWILPIGVFVAVMLFVRAMYRRDAVELYPALGWILTILRFAAFLGLLILYLQPQWRCEREVIRNSRVMLLVDTSLSMGLTDSRPFDGVLQDSTTVTKPRPLVALSRIGQVAAAFEETDLLEQLRSTHDVFVLRFNDALDRDRVALGKLYKAATVGRAQPHATRPQPIDWSEFLAPGGTETRLGAALRQLINDESPTPLSGIIVFTDGGQNAGIAPREAVDLARKTNVPIFTVGIGSDQRPTNVRVSDLVAPARAYPGDSYIVTGFVQAQGMPGQVVDVELLSREAAGSFSGRARPTRVDNGGLQHAHASEGMPPGQIEARQQITLGGDGEVLPVKFELTPEQPGRRTLCFHVRPPAGDHNSGDNYREVDIEIVDRRNRVLMLAGGPTREYRFLRALLYRDRSTMVDVLLQSGQPGMSQEADKLLADFPSSREEMFDYDCLLAFDPDWQALGPVQVDLLEQWVAEQGGGLIVIAGPVFTGTMIGGWVENPAMAKIRALYPVEFSRRFSVLEESAYVTEEPWPLEFSREGLDAEYLWLGDTATAGRQAWAGHEGVYSFCLVKGPKPGATVLARFSDPRAGQTGRQPVFFAEQFYGAGRVFYLGSGEMWRLRRLDETYFEQFYTKLLRHVSQGRLLRGSSRGVLLTGQDRYLLGNTVEVRTQVTNARLEPLDTPGVELQVIAPAGGMQTITLRPDPSRIGTYAGRFPVLEEGSYRLELPLPESDDERLSRRIQVRVPDLERENPQRNNKLLSEIAKSSQGGEPKDQEQKAKTGEYYLGIDELLNPPPSKQAVTELLEDRTRTDIFPQAPNTDWEETWLRWMMFALCGLLCCEWLIRRLVKLA